MPFTHAPGSPEATARGCTCPPALNRHERTTLGSHKFHYCDPNCLTHGNHIDGHFAEGQDIVVRHLPQDGISRPL